MDKIPAYIIRLIAGHLKKQLKEPDRKRLEQWQEAHPEYAREIAGLEDIIRKTIDAERFRQIDVEAAWQKVDRRTCRLPGWKKNILTTYGRIAASILLPLAISCLTLYHYNRAEQQAEPANQAQTEQQIVKQTGAILELSNGKTIILQSATRQEIDNNGVTVGIDTSNTIRFNPQSDQDSTTTERFNCIYVPIGGEYSVILCDGTKIWVNSDSRLKFPDRFSGSERIVELCGEAYFEVTKSGKPFIVKTGVSAIRVLGTSFNVCSYQDEDREQITLVSGAVKVLQGPRSYPLRPGEQMSIQRNTRNVIIQQVETDLYTSWKTDMLRFQDMPIEELTIKLKRWYNVNFSFTQEEHKKYRFTGVVYKNTDLYDFLKLIESTTNIQFQVNGNDVIITRK